MAVEHRAVLDALAAHRRAGRLLFIWSQSTIVAGWILRCLNDVCRQGVDLVCVMAANNEVGVIYPVEQIGQIAARFGALSLVDATQAAGHIPIRADEWNVTYLALSAHKIYGPKGVGALIAPPGFGSRSSHCRVRWSR